MSNYIESTKRKLRSAITQLCDTSWMFVKDPERDFTRKRKLPFTKRGTRIWERPSDF